jgi:hypothetical protein
MRAHRYEVEIDHDGVTYLLLARATTASAAVRVATKEQPRLVRALQNGTARVRAVRDRGVAA